MNEAFMVGEIMEITLNSYEWNDRVVPSDTSGGYLYLEGEEEALQYFYDDRYPHENYTITFFSEQESSAVEE